jgi:hypothetical protein
MPVAEKYFLHYAAHGDFEQGIFMPFDTQVDAERQAASDLLNGCDPDFIEQIFTAPYDPPKFGWKRSDLAFKPEEELNPHLVEKNRKRTATAKQIQQRAKKHQDDMLNEMVKAQGDYLLEMNQAIKEGSFFKNSVPGNAYTWCTGGTATATPAALSAATAKTVVLILAASVNQPAITEIGVSFDGVTSSAVPVLVELVSGTAGTAGTPRAALAAGKQLRGWPASTSQTTAADTYSGEPGTQLVNRKWFVPPNGGLFVEQYPLGREPTGIITSATDAKTWSIRLTAPATVNAHAYIEFEE